jgi:uncharacterized protein YecE (DUF72 family)
MLSDMTAASNRQFNVGTCGYSYPGGPPQGWGEIFYPKAVGRRLNELEFYASYFNLVEVNSTFYRLPKPTMTRAWVSRTSDDFKFAVKAWQKFTHAIRLGGESNELRPWEPFEASDVELFSVALMPLAEAGKLAALLFQYPAGFHFAPENVERIERTLEAFAGFPKVVELRHRSWSDHESQTRKMLDSRASAWVFIDEPKFASSVRQDIDAHGDLAYLRLHGRNSRKWWKHDEAWERYDYFYSRAEVQRLAAKLKELAARSPNAQFNVLFNNHARGQAVANALMLKAEFYPDAPRSAPRTMIQRFADLSDFVAG